MRTEHDTMGAVEVPDNAYYGAQTQRAVENFPISGKTMPSELIHALGLVKWACAKANAELGLLQSGRSPLSDEQIGRRRDEYVVFYHSSIVAENVGARHQSRNRKIALGQDEELFIKQEYYREGEKKANNLSPFTV
jgi:hypothetical protein